MRSGPLSPLVCVGLSHVAAARLKLIPLFLIIGSGGVGAALYLMRLAVFNPDVCWDKKNNPEPWNKLSPSDQYKFYSVNVDYSKLKKDRPDF
ncbi:PREDICTED: cytochrome c oxidase subunit NDUFA4-like [Chlamydotis macqueenii]|uniref:cytochrome c oxidase subunit NDUFA4-like n=2 Tax=Neoaves TaxID=3078114 RepID=UPI000529DE1D|nr:PREDICTED: cytochrome c oxidase subunit NDUFA4-like [Chlamydotis macqueenii]